MTDDVARLLVVVVVLVVAWLTALVLNRFHRPAHPSLTVNNEGDRPGIVLFTSLDCSTCKRTIHRLRGDGISFREITHELEPQRFESWGVLAVPLTVVIDRGSEVVDMIPGVPPSRRLRRALDAAGITVGT